MAGSLSASLTSFGQSMTCIGASLAHSVLMVFSSVVHLAITVAESTVRLVDASQALAVDMFQDIVGLVAANLVAILVVGSAYYVYSQEWHRRNQQPQSQTESAEEAH